MNLTIETIRNQINAAHLCRTGESRQFDGITEGRITQYRQLVQSVFYDTIENAFPIAHSIIEAEDWRKLLDAFMIEHKAQTPQVWKLPYEFVEYVIQSGWSIRLKMAYLNDLLIFEWLEIDVHTMADISPFEYNLEGDLNTGEIVVTQEFVVQPLSYPVHQIPAKETPAHQGNYFVLIFRRLEDGEVCFVNLSPILVFVVEKLKEKPLNLSQLSQQIGLLLGSENIKEINSHVFGFLQRMKRIGFVLGFANTKTSKI